MVKAILYNPTVKAILSTSMEMVEELTDHMIREGRHPGSQVDQSGLELTW